MGRLISFDEDFRHVDHSSFARRMGEEKRGQLLNPEWYFERTRRNTGGYYATWDIEHNYPYNLAIHFDVLKFRTSIDESEREARRLKIQIRKFVEREIQTDVIWLLKAMNYYIIYPPDTVAGRKPITSEVYHGYMILYFETKADAVLFKLRFCDVVSEVSADHPTFAHDSTVLRANSLSAAHTLIREKFDTYRY